MDYLRIRFRCPSNQGDRLSAVLEAAGALAVTIENGGEDPYFEVAYPAPPSWKTVHVTGLFPGDADWRDIEAAVRSAGIGVPANVDTLADRDWQRAWLAEYRPLAISDNLYICPTWLSAPDPAATVVYLDPGLAFGTGTHVTTRMCLEEFAQLDWRAKTVIDYGCGSGILAITALKLGACRATGVDIDPLALRASAENAQRNGVAERFTACAPQHLDGAPADVLVANILADVIIDLAYTLVSLVARQGRIVLTGILTSQVERVRAAFAYHCTLEVRHHDGWSLITGRRVR